MSNSSQASSSGVGVFGTLGIIFVVLKLTGVVDWSWWWVTLPFWGPVAILFTFILTATLFAVVIKMVSK